MAKKKDTPENKVTPLKGFVIVQVEKERLDEIKHGSLKLEAPVGWNEQGKNAFRYAQTKGVVAGIPRDDERISRDLRVGDTIYFHYNAIRSNRPQYKFEVDGEIYYQFFYDFVFLRIRDGVITPMNDRALCTAIWEDPDLEEIEIEGKKQRVKISEGGIITQINVAHNDKKATLVAVDPYHQEVYEEAIGKTILYDKHADFEIEVEGQKYFTMLLEDISAVEYEE